MKIRALTLGQPMDNSASSFQNLKSNLQKMHELKEILTSKEIEVEYVRFASPKIDATTKISVDHFYFNCEQSVSQLDKLCTENLIGIYSFAPIIGDQAGELSDSQTKILKSLPNLLKNHPNMFSSVQVATTINGINFKTLQHAIQIVKEIASPDPFNNVQFAITSNVPGNTPFFPSAYYCGKEPTVSIALEAADELNQILSQYSPKIHSFMEIQTKIKKKFEDLYDSVSVIAQNFCLNNGFKFEGIDISPAPYPTYERSIGTALELVGLGKFGDLGSVFGVGFLTQAIQSIDRPKIGFSGFMQPLLEDYTIARRNNEGHVDITKLLLYSTMCGLGLDCVPIPGDVSKEEMQLLLMDLSMISIRLNKPLTARLMPIPNKKAGKKQILILNTLPTVIFSKLKVK